jgi:hypothetical protein
MAFDDHDSASRDAPTALARLVEIMADRHPLGSFDVLIENGPARFRRGSISQLSTLTESSTKVPADANTSAEN